MNSIIIKDKLTGREIKFWAEEAKGDICCVECCFNPMTCDRNKKLVEILEQSIGECTGLKEKCYKAKEIRR